MANGFATLLRVWTHHSFTVFVVSRLQGQGGIRFVPAFMVKNPKKTWPQSKPRSASIGISLTGKNGAPAQRLCRRRQRAGLGKSGDRVDGNARGYPLGFFRDFKGQAEWSASNDGVVKGMELSTNQYLLGRSPNITLVDRPSGTC